MQDASSTHQFHPLFLSKNRGGKAAATVKGGDVKIIQFLHLFFYLFKKLLHVLFLQTPNNIRSFFERFVKITQLLLRF